MTMMITPTCQPPYHIEVKRTQPYFRGLPAAVAELCLITLQYPFGGNVKRIMY